MTGQLRHGGLFDGGGGLALAVEAALGARTVWHCETDPAASLALAWNWPDVPNYGDVTDLRAGELPLVDVVSGGFPCQDVSPAGRGLGLAPGTRSGLWSKMLWVIDDQARRARAAGQDPPIVVVENVKGLLSAEAHSDVERCPDCLGDGAVRPLRALGAVLGDLADLGLDAEWGVQSAASAGFAHVRERVFVVAADPSRRRRDPRPDGPLPGVPAPVGRPHPAGGHRRSLWGRHAPAVAAQETVLGRAAPPPIAPGARGGAKLNPRFVEWLMGWPPGHVTAVPGLEREACHRILGNGVVPLPGAWAITQLVGRLLEVTPAP